MLNPVHLSPPRKVQLLVFSLGLLFLLLSFARSASAQQPSIPGLRSPVEKKDTAGQELPVKFRAARGRAPLNRLYDHVRVSPSKVRRLPALSPREVQDEGTEKRHRIGQVRDFVQPIKVTSDSTLYRVTEGDVRVMGVVSEGARYTRVHITGMTLPAGARVFVYSMQNPEEFYGPYEGRGPAGDGSFWTPPMEGEGVAIEYFTPHGASDSATPFQVSEVSHVFRDPLTKAGLDDAAGTCNLEVSAAWAEVAKSVGQLQFTSDGSEYLCTGTLLNNQANDFTPYLLTANHCFGTQAEAQTLRVYWNYNSGGVPPPGTPYTDGANLLATGKGSDFTFVVLTGSLPGGLFFSGWDANPISIETPVTGIHHPKGSHKRISSGTTNNYCPGNILPGPCSSYASVIWNSGTTEPGSSGSGIWQGTASNPQLVATLTGGDSSCQNPKFIDYYGRFSDAYPSLAPFLTMGAGASCVSALGPVSQNIPSTGGTGSISVTAPAGCNWAAAKSHSFVTITSSTSGSGNATINFSVAPNTGAYRAAVIVVGTQVFTITQASGISSNCSPNSISPDQTKNGTLSRLDCQRNDGSYTDRYLFNGIAGQQISLSMTASFDAYLIMRSPNDSVLATDDNGGGGTNSRIPAGSGMITLPSTGLYTIYVTSASPYVTGSYTLSMSAAPLVIPSASVNDASFAEGHSETTFARITITLSAPSIKSVCVAATTADGTALAYNDYYPIGAPLSGTPINNPPQLIFFSPGSTSATMTVQVRGDTVIEPDETFLVNINTCSADVTIGKAQGVGTIVNDDLPPMKLILNESGTEPNQAVAIDSLLFLRDPLAVVNAGNLLNQATDKNTRVTVFVTNLQLAQGETASAVRVNLVDGNHQMYEVAAEDVRTVPGLNFAQVRFRLPNTLGPGTCTIKVKAHGQESNSGTIRIGS